jgi:hypothetical protein
MKIINLLPKPRQEELEYEKILHSLLKFIWSSIITFLLVLGGQYATHVFAQTQLVSVQKEIDNLKGQVNKKENSEIKKEIKVLNDLINDFKVLGINSTRWTKVLEAFSILPPENITINSLEFDFAKKTLRMTGESPDRETVLEFYNRILRADNHFSISEIPLENIARSEDINFHFTLTINDSLLK